MIKNTFNKIKNYLQAISNKIDYYFEACQIDHFPKSGERTGFIEGSSLRSPDGVIWTVKDGKFSLKEN